jgi:hypothetical protein
VSITGTSANNWLIMKIRLVVIVCLIIVLLCSPFVIAGKGKKKSKKILVDVESSKPKVESKDEPSLTFSPSSMSTKSILDSSSAEVADITSSETVCDSREGEPKAIVDFANSNFEDTNIHSDKPLDSMESTKTLFTDVESSSEEKKSVLSLTNW